MRHSSLTHNDDNSYSRAFLPQTLRRSPRKKISNTPPKKENFEVPTPDFVGFPTTPKKAAAHAAEVVEARVAFLRFFS